MEPARAVAAEDRIPVDVAELHRCRGRVRPIRGSQGRPHAEAALDEVETVAHSSPDAVVGTPHDVALVDATLQDQVLEEAADGVVGECGDDRRAQPEAAAQTSRHVVLAAALGDGERASRRDPTFAGIEAEHHLAERDEVEAALLGGLDREEAHAGTATEASSTASRARRSISSNRWSSRSVRSQIHVPPHARTAGSSR